jgi:hypothetical protein
LRVWFSASSSLASTRFADVVAQQQRHADGHIVQPARRVQTRPEGKTQIAGRQL